MEKLCLLFGISRQAYYQYNKYVTSCYLEQEIVLKEVIQIRSKHKCMGGRKLYTLLDSFMINHQIKMGRDAFFNLLSANKLLIKKRKTRIFTTQSSHWLRKYKNKIKNFTPTEANQLYVSDITYWKIGSGHVYVSLITDAFSHKVVGYNLAQTLEAVESIKALEMSLSNLKTKDYKLIHHSDRGVQYCCGEYVKLLQDNNIEISMTENGDPLENAIAERINGILKGEYLECYDIETFEEAKKLLHAVINLYNDERPHMSIGNLTPNYVHDNNLITNKLWKNYYQKKEEMLQE